MNREDAPESGPLDNVDVRQIMAQIRQRVEQQRNANAYPPDVWAVSSRPVRPSSMAGSLAEHLSSMQQAATVDVLGEPIRSHRPVAGFFIKMFKKFTRYWVRKYTDSLFLRQSYFNAETVAAMEAMRQEIEELRAAVAESRTPPPTQE
jgi:hypothetical protein